MPTIIALAFFKSSTVIVLDCFLQLQSAYNMLRITLLMSLICSIVVFLLLAFFFEKGHCALRGKSGTAETVYHGCVA